jgi:hypothetical protein
MRTRDGMRWRPPRRLREAAMKAGHSVLLPLRTAGSPPLACPRRPATILLCTGRPFRQWLPALGELRQPAGSSVHRPPLPLAAWLGRDFGHLARPALAVGGDAHFRPFAVYHVAWLMASRGDPAPREPPEAVTVRGEVVEVVARCHARASHSPANTNDIWHDASDRPCRGCCAVVIYAHLHPQTVGNFPGRYTGACGHRHARVAHHGVAAARSRVGSISQSSAVMQ